MVPLIKSLCWARVASEGGEEATDPHRGRKTLETIVTTQQLLWIKNRTGLFGSLPLCYEFVRLTTTPPKIPSLEGAVVIKTFHFCTLHRRFSSFYVFYIAWEGRIRTLWSYDYEISCRSFKYGTFLVNRVEEKPWCTRPQQRKKEKGYDEREIRSSLLILDLKDGKGIKHMVWKGAKQCISSHWIY